MGGEGGAWHRRPESKKEVGIPAFKYTSKENLILMIFGAMTYLKPHTWEGRANTQM